MRHALASLIFVLPLTAACGFSPVYSADAPLSAGAIDVAEIPGRMGYELRKELQRELAAGLPGIPEGAVLSIELQERLGRLPLRPDGAAARSDQRAQASYVLTYEGGEFQDTVAAEATFNAPSDAYGDITAQIASRERAAKLIAQRIATDLRLKAGSADGG